VTYNTRLPKFDRFMPEWFLDWTLGEDHSSLQDADSQGVWPTTQPTTLPVLGKDPEFSADSDTPPDGAIWVSRADQEIHVRVGDKVYSAGPLKPVARDSVAVVPQLRISETIMFILHLSAAFGIGFQVPVVVAFISLIGVASASEMKKLRRYIWFAMAAASAVLTPPDPASMLLLLFPMMVLLEIGLLAARVIERGRAA
jgi:hypothetical protein